MVYHQKLSRLLTALTVPVLPLLVATSATAQDPGQTLPPLQVVVLVDESGSLSQDDVVKEQEAARTIAFSVLAPGSTVSVVGFGSSNAPGQSAVDVACPPTLLDTAQKRDSLANCVGALHRRKPEEGDGTDHVAALQQAYDFIARAGQEKKVVFLLTDGKLDVSSSPHWGDTAARRNGAAAAKVKEVLADLEATGAQVWPLGFGKVDQAALQGFAKGRSCTPAARDPHEQITPTSAELLAALNEAFSAASCVKYGPIDRGNLPQGGSVELTIDIPAAASDASILVYKRDPRVQVEYRAPNASQPAPAAGGSAFEFAGQTTQTESLRITDPEPGRWTIRLSSADVPAQDVAATVVYQAAVKAFLTISPPQPAAGQAVDVNMQVWARGRAVTDRQTLQGLSFVTALTGSAGFSEQRVTLADDDGDGTFTGQLRVPDGASGDLTFTGQVTGIGIGGDTRVLSTKVQAGVAALQAQILFDSNRAAVTPGGTVSGTVSVTNNSGQPAGLRLEVADPSPGTALTVEPAVVQATTGVSTARFTLRFDPNTALGTSAATLRLVDAADPGLVVAQRLFAAEVAPEPGIAQQLFWLWVALAVLLAGALVYLLSRLRARHEAGKVRGLRVQLLQSGFVVSELEPRDPGGKLFGFVIHEDFTGLQLQHAGPAEANVYQIRRDGRRISLATPGGTQALPLAPGKAKDIGRDLAIAVQDERGLADAGVASGPVADVSFNPFGATVSGGPVPGPHSGPDLDPFAGSTRPAPATTPGSSAPADPFGSPDPFGGNPFAIDAPPRRPDGDSSRPGQQSPPARDSYLDTMNPFG